MQRHASHADVLHGDCNAPQADERARKMESLIRRQVMSCGQAELARRTARDESKISRLMNGDLELITQILTLAGLKVVPRTVKCYDPEYIESIFKLAQIGMKHPPQELDWEEGV